MGKLRARSVIVISAYPYVGIVPRWAGLVPALLDENLEALEIVLRKA